MRKQNCWEFKKCERNPGGKRIGEFGICPASADKSLNTVHGGMNGGRACWAIAGTFCEGTVQGSEAQKQQLCWECDFFNSVRNEEGSSPRGFSATMHVMRRSVLARR